MRHTRLLEAFVLPMLGVLLLASTPCRAQTGEFHWTISASSTDPFENTLPFVMPGIERAYLWLASCDLPEPVPDGMSAASFSIQATNVQHLGTNLRNGFLNAGTAQNPVLAVAGCPCMVVAAELLLFVSEPGGSLCLATNPDDGEFTTVDCQQVPERRTMTWTGLGIGVPPPTENCVIQVNPGGCCLPDGSCVIVMDEPECTSMGGNFLGEGTDCTAACPTGACCLPDETCVEASTAAECSNLGGTFLGFGSDCSGATCTSAGACCLPDGICISTNSEASCAAMGGTFQGSGTSCATTSCADGGACCLPGSTCTFVTDRSTCESLGGTYRGDGTTCVLGCPAPGTGAGWTVSASNMDPFENLATFVPGLHTAYVWLACADFPDGTLGMAAAAFNLESTGNWLLVSSTPQNGFLDAGSQVGEMFLAVGSCPSGPLVAASLLILVFDSSPASLCFAPPPNGPLETIACDNDRWGFNWVGLSVNGAARCFESFPCEIAPTSIEEASWGEIKALYR